MSAAGWDTMHAIFDTIKKLNGDLSDGMKVVNAMKGWKADGPRGPVQIDPDTRDIIQNEHAMEVYPQAGRQTRRAHSWHNREREGRMQGA